METLELNSNEFEVLKKQNFISFESVPPKKGCICSSSCSLIDNPSDYEKAWLAISPHIFCICLKDRADRFQEACNVFHRYGLCRIVKFYRAERPSLDEMEKLQNHGIKCRGLLGVWMSHYIISLWAKLNGCEKALIFEDDVTFINQYMSPHKLTKIAKDMTRLPKNGWEIFYLGHIPFWGRPYTFDTRIFRVGSMMAHAYVLSQQGIAKLASRDYLSDTIINKGKERGIDAWFFSDFVQYACFPQIAVQSGSLTSNNGNTERNLEKWFWEEVVPWGIDLHRDLTLLFEIITYVIIPLLIFAILIWCSKSKNRMLLLSSAFIVLPQLL